MDDERRTTEEINILCDVSDRKKLVTAVEYSRKGGIITGVGAMLGGLILGPIGFPIGGLIGGCVATVVTWKKFVPASKIIKKLSGDKKKALIAHVKRRLSNIGLQDALKLGSGFVFSGNIIDSIAMFITEFLNDVKI